MSPPAPLFAPTRRRAVRARARARLSAAPNPIHDRMIASLADRLALVDRPLARLLLVGALDPAAPAALAATLGPVAIDACGDDEAPPAGNYDAVLVAGLLDTADDLAARLAMLAAALAPDRPLILAAAGPGAGARVRAAWLARESASGRVAGRFHPTLTGPALAQLAAAAGLVEPTVESDRFALTYSSLSRWLADARDLALTNQLSARAPLPPRAITAQLAADLGAPFAENGEILLLGAWSRPAD